jgi:hypothetical protein
MRVICAAAAAAMMVLTPLQAGAKEFNLASLSCSAFRAASDDEKIVITAWIEGYDTEEDDPKVVDPEEVDDDTDTLDAYCAKNPSAKLMDAAEEAFE